MKKYLLILLVLFACVNLQTYSQSSCKQYQAITDNRVPVIVLSGQSNAVGQFAAKNYGHIYIPIEQYNKECDSIDIWYEGNYLTKDTNTGTFVKMKPNINTFGWYVQSDPSYSGYDVGEYSVEQSCSRLLSQLYGGKKVYVIKSAKGNRDIRSWDAANDSTQWVELERYIRRATATILASGKIPYFVSMAWLQGESDIINGTTANYLPRLRTLITNIRGINQYTDSMQFVMFRLSLYGNTPITDMNTVNAAYDSVVTDNPVLNKIIETKGSTYYNSLHYDCPALIFFGSQWYNLIRSELIRSNVIKTKHTAIR